MDASKQVYVRFASQPPPPPPLPAPLAIYSGGIVNGATFAAGAPVSAGSIVSLFGTNLAAAAVSAASFPSPLTLGDVQVLVNGSPVPLIYVSPAQINFLMPPNVSPGTAQIVVLTGGVSSSAVSISVSAFFPAIFSNPPGGTGQAAVLNEDFSANSTGNLAASGSVIQINATALGPTDPPVAAGQPGPSGPYSLTTSTPQVLIGGVNATDVQFSGLAPGYVGLYQINVRLPDGLAPGSTVSLQITISGQSSNIATIAVQ